MSEHRKENGPIKSWKDLEVWKLSHSLVLRTYDCTSLFPAGERFRLTDQLCRAVASVPTNIAEGKGRMSVKSFVYFLLISRGSVEEVKYLFLLAHDLKYLNDELYKSLSLDCERISQMLTALIKALRRHVQ